TREAPRAVRPRSQLELHPRAGSTARVDPQLPTERIGTVPHRDQSEAAPRLVVVEAGSVIYDLEPHARLEPFQVEPQDLDAAMPRRIRDGLRRDSHDGLPLAR